jgi:predicted DNA-binding transcriptional regulator AlpA
MEEAKLKPGGPRLMGNAEIIAMFGLSTARAHQLMSDDTFPPPIAKLKAGKIWLAEDVEAWERARQARMKERAGR